MCVKKAFSAYSLGRSLGIVCGCVCATGAHDKYCHRPCGIQSWKYLLTGPLQKRLPTPALDRFNDLSLYSSHRRGPFSWGPTFWAVARAERLWAPWGSEGSQFHRVRTWVSCTLSVCPSARQQGGWGEFSLTTFEQLVPEEQTDKFSVAYLWKCDQPLTPYFVFTSGHISILFACIYCNLFI